MSENELPSLSTSLLVQVRRMQPEAWTRLVETFSPIVYGWCRKSGLKEQDSSDVVQDVFSSVARGIQKFERKKEKGSFRSWLATITRTRVIDSFRRQEKFPDAQGGSEFLQKIGNTPDSNDSVEDTISEMQLNRAIPIRVMALVQNEVEAKTWHCSTWTFRTSCCVTDFLTAYCCSIMLAIC